MPSIVINNGVPAKEEECGCKDSPKGEIEGDDVGIIKALAPELFKVLTSRSYLLDMCNLSRMKREHDVCPVSCDTVAYSSHACCKKPGPCECQYCLPGGVGPATGRGVSGTLAGGQGGGQGQGGGGGGQGGGGGGFIDEGGSTWRGTGGGEFSDDDFSSDDWHPDDKPPPGKGPGKKWPPPSSQQKRG